MLRVKGSIATELGERYYGLRPANFPLPCRILADLPAHGSKLGQSLTGLLATLLHGLGIRLVRPDVAGKGIDLHAPDFAGIDPAA